MENIVKVTLHGHLGDAIGKEWKLAVKSVREAVHAIEILSKHQFYKHVLQKERERACYKFLINEQPVVHSINYIDENNMEEITKTELVMENKNLRSIDIVPVIEGTDAKLLGIILIVVGVLLIAVGGPILIGAGITTWTTVILVSLVLVAGGVSLLLSKPPQFAPFRDIDKSVNKSYFFSGPINILQEGGPVPLGYGEALVGSQVISAGYSVSARQALADVNGFEPGGGYGGHQSDNKVYPY